MYEGALD